MAKAAPSGDAQTAAAGTVLPTPLRVVITQSGSGVAGRTVTWVMQPANNGEVNPASSVTGADGIASTTVTLAGFATTSTITATSSGVTNSPLSFSAISTGVGTQVVVNVVNTSFQPANFQIKQGGVVTFLWSSGSGPHTVTPVPPNNIPVSTPAGAQRNAPFTFDVTFASTGTFKYFCEVHGAADSGMSGTITVVP
jgi:plastocyanin